MISSLNKYDKDPASFEVEKHSYDFEIDVKVKVEFDVLDFDLVLNGITR